VPTVYLRKGAPPVRIARGPHVAVLEPGGYVDVHDDLADVAVAVGATRRSRPSGRDATGSAEGADEGHE
jgi:hypothetical protein